MTLIVSLKTPDGIVIVGDSLSTLSKSKLLENNFNPECPKCGHYFEFKGRISYTYPSNTLSNTQKVFPFLEKFGVGASGMGQVSGKTIYFAIRELEKDLQVDRKTKSITEVAKIISEHIRNLLIEELNQDKKSLASDSYPNY